MNRWIRKAVMVSSIAGSLALLPGGVAFAQQPAQGQHAGHAHGPHGGLLRDALKLDSLSAEQRSQIEKLVDGHKTAEVPVRQALEPSMNAEASAARNARTVEVNALSQLHGVLTVVQRNQIVDSIASRLPQGKAVPPVLEAFRGDSFDANALVRDGKTGARVVEHAEAKVPSMSAEQRATFASHLRARAAKESKV